MLWVRAGIVVVLLALPSIAGADGKFPELKPEGACADGFSPQFQDGPDFYIWRCQREGATPDASAGSGIYFGLHPTLFQPTSGVTQVAGVVAGKTITWAQWHEGQTIRREAVFSYQHSPDHLEIKLHAFIAARSQAELDAILRALAGARLVERTPNAA